MKHDRQISQPIHVLIGDLTIVGDRIRNFDNALEWRPAEKRTYVVGSSLKWLDGSKVLQAKYCEYERSTT